MIHLCYKCGAAIPGETEAGVVIALGFHLRLHEIDANIEAACNHRRPELNEFDREWLRESGIRPPVSLYQ